MKKSLLVLSRASVLGASIVASRTGAQEAIRFDTPMTEFAGWLHSNPVVVDLSSSLLVSYLVGGTNPAPHVVANGPLLPVDRDHDGVPDYLDRCPGTSADAAVDGNGYSIEQLCPCDGPWKNHGDYVKAVASQAARFVQEG